MLDWQESEGRGFYYEQGGWRLDVVGWETGAAWYVRYNGLRVAWANARDVGAAKVAAAEYLSEELEV